MLSQQRHEVTQSLYYYAKIEESDQLLNKKLTEEEYDMQQIHLTSLLEDLTSNNITKFNDATVSTTTSLLFSPIIHIYVHACY